MIVMHCYGLHTLLLFTITNMCLYQISPLSTEIINPQHWKM